jgi:hypothetical protein
MRRYRDAEQNEANSSSNDECAWVIGVRMNRIGLRRCLPRHYGKDISLCHSSTGYIAN